MENSESGDEIPHRLFGDDPQYLLNPDDMIEKEIMRTWNAIPEILSDLKKKLATAILSIFSSTYAEQGDNTDDSGQDQYKNLPLREQDRFLPIANVAKIMKRAIPDNGKIAKDARECVQECVSEFISFITSEASDRCHMEKRKTINGEDILFAMTTLGFDNYVEPLKLYLQKYREVAISASRIDKQLSNSIVYEEISEEAYKNSQVQLLAESGSQSDTVIYTAYPNNIGEYQIS